MSLIPADQPLSVIAALFAIAAFGFWAERQAWGRAVTGTVWVIIVALLAGNLGVLPSDSPAYGAVSSYLVPILIPLFLFGADLRRILGETGRLFLAFVLAIGATASGALIAGLLLPLGAFEPLRAEISGLFTATYIGGSVNWAAAIDSLGLGGNGALISAGTAVDYLYSVAWLGALAAAPAIQGFAARFVTKDHSGTAATETETKAQTGSRIDAGSLAGAIAVAAITAAVGTALADALGLSAYKYLFITVLVVIPATLIPKRMAKLHGGYELGVGLAFVYFASIVAGADIPTLIATAPLLAVFVGVIIIVHGLVMVIGGLVLKLSLPELITASNAAVLGPTTAPALAASRGWTGLVTPGVLVGVFGYATGTFVALAVARALGWSP
ncbi:MAG: DUF819 domain-containing protein [Maricaulaceae bacterium]